MAETLTPAQSRNYAFWLVVLFSAICVFTAASRAFMNVMTNEQKPAEELYELDLNGHHVDHFVDGDVECWAHSSGGLHCRDRL